MNLQDLDFQYPESLVALSPAEAYRILLGGPEPREISKAGFFDLFREGDLLVLNDTAVEKRRVFSVEPQLEILFLKSIGEKKWDVLFPARTLSVGDVVTLPGDTHLTLLQKGLPQKVELDRELSADYFLKHGELALPPYIQNARGERHQTKDDESWYQTHWASKTGSVAAPTASLHFTNQDLLELKKRGVRQEKLTLHVGIGTFLPIKVDNLNDHVMHHESVFVPRSVVEAVEETKSKGGRVWALGTTVTRSLESLPLGILQKTPTGDFFGESNLFIKPGFEFTIVDCLLTNFHQPRSTLIALVMAFAGRENVLTTYQKAIADQFRLFSYGDLSVWQR